ncbi:MAG TPA: GGDEF domain-containing protein [Burkholderiales bacterium]|nr:GGDEF domain-containing protein [Burkholderiales bacterium]
MLDFRDSVTGLGGRELLEEFLLFHVALARRRRTPLGLIYADVEQLDRVNRLLGRDAGDALLRLVVVRMRAALRASDPLVRAGPDEFAALLPDAGDFGAIVVTEKVRRACAGWYIAQGAQQPLRVTVGSSVFPADGDSADALLRRAEAATYRMKVADRQIFGPLGRCTGAEYVLGPRSP